MINLIDSSWLQIARRSGEAQRIRPADIVSEELVAIDLLAPRPDFRAALYQFLVGLLQTTFAPADPDEWMDRWESLPSVVALEAAFAPYRHAFDLNSTGPAFMQDFDLGPAEPGPISGLLIDAPGGNTVELNKDHFVHRGSVQAICPNCAATALFTLQINAPSGGQGHRVSLRGGGPLTTLRMPSDPYATLWQKLWLNVIPQDLMPHDPQRFELAKVLPWMAPTRSSDPTGVGTTEPLPECAHLLQAYWSMPRRIRLDFTQAAAGICDLCGESSERLTTEYRTRNYGVNYAGAWVHPLTPYSYDPKQSDLPISIKGQKGGVGYRQWLALTLGGGTVKPAMVVSSFATLHGAGGPAQARLWAFGLDMDNMKARCWYDATLPLYALDPAQVDDFREALQAAIDVADEAARSLNRSVKEAWFSRPKDKSSDPAVQQSFWQASESGFYRFLRSAAETDMNDDATCAPLFRSWLLDVRRTTLDLFDQWALSSPVEELKMQRVVEAKANLAKSLNKGAAADLWKIVNRRGEDRMTYAYLKDAQPEILRAWWRALQAEDQRSDGNPAAYSVFRFDRGPRARMRRCHQLVELDAESATWKLGDELRQRNSGRTPWVAKLDQDGEAISLIAGALALVRDDVQDARSLAYRLGAGPAARDEKPLLSELRFQRLMRAEDPDDFFVQLRRALKIGDSRVDVVALADDLVAWSTERRQSNRRSNGIKFRWARDFYLKRADQGLLVPPSATI